MVLVHIGQITEEHMSHCKDAKKGSSFPVSPTILKTYLNKSQALKMSWHSYFRLAFLSRHILLQNNKGLIVQRLLVISVVKSTGIRDQRSN